jgi:hypothetical protein
MVSISAPQAAEPGDAVTLEVDVRDATFVAAVDASVEGTISEPGHDPRAIVFRAQPGDPGRFTAVVQLSQAGTSHIQVRALRGESTLGSADRWMLIGGNREFAGPRLNTGVLTRLAEATGGQYVAAADASKIASLLAALTPQNVSMEYRDVWHTPWVFALIAALPTVEWILRRRWGLR